MSDMQAKFASVMKGIDADLVRKDAILCAAANQVRRAVEYNSDCEEDSSGNNPKGECYLAIVAMTMHLETAISRWQFNKPQDFAKVFESNAFSAAQRLKFAPRFFGNCSKTTAEKYEALTLHNEINELFKDRNKIVHGNTEKFSDKVERASTIKRYWDATLDIMYEFEVCGDFLGAAMSRCASEGVEVLNEITTDFDGYRAELDKLKKFVIPDNVGLRIIVSEQK